MFLKNCGDVYKEIINKIGECQKNGKAHDPLYDFQ